MIHPVISDALAKSRQQDRRRRAEQQRIARAARSRADRGQTRAGRLAKAVIGPAAILPVRVLRPQSGAPAARQRPRGIATIPSQQSTTREMY